VVSGRPQEAHPDLVSTSPVSVPSHAPGRATSPLAEVLTGLVIIIASSYAIAVTLQTPVITTIYGLALGVVARHMSRSGVPRSLRWLCLIFAVAALALAVLAFVT
jgi:hypothetical protein